MGYGALVLTGDGADQSVMAMTWPLTYTHYASGGVNLSGGAFGLGVGVGGAASITSRSSSVITPSGGVSVGGSAPLLITSSITPTGGVGIGGVAAIFDLYPLHIPSGGVNVSGAALAYMVPTRLTPTIENPYFEPFTAWAVTLPQGAVSRYDSMPATSCCFFKGKLYVTNAAGVYAVDNTSDNGAVIHSSVDFGMTDMGSAHNKLLPAVYVAARSLGQLQLAVRTLGGETRNYALNISAATSVRGARATLGRGISARYWQLRIASLNGSTFELDAVSLLPTILKRRGV